uniref:Uncharacterized protein n=1 Tax=Arundo donax TaxID=35708 RepID=A0A0A9EAX1_ARUDO
MLCRYVDLFLRILIKVIWYFSEFYFDFCDFFKVDKHWCTLEKHGDNLLPFTVAGAGHARW